MSEEKPLPTVLNHCLTFHSPVCAGWRENGAIQLSPWIPLSNFDSHNEGLVGGTDGEGDDDLAAAVGGGGERLDQCRVFPDRGIDVEVGEHGSAVDGYVEDAVPAAVK